MTFRLMVMTGLWALATSVSYANEFPTKPVTLVVAYAPGGMTDILTRRIAATLQTKLGQPFIVENRAGAAGQVATDHVRKQAPDGYTILVGATSHVINPAMKTLPYDARTAFAPIALLAVSPNFLLINANKGIKTFAQFQSWAKTEVSIGYGTAGTGGAPHIVGELLRKQSSLPLSHIAYRGGSPAMADLVAGQIPFGISESVTANAYLESGKILPLAVASAKRQSRYPEVPTLNELGFHGFDLSTWVGVYAPAGTPQAILELLNKEIREAISQPSTHDYIVSTGSEPGNLDLTQYRAFVAAEFAKWKSVITEADVKNE